ncbi:MAG: hypothetical protein FWD69_00555 [Polyangiaceae bacterium]|nr:hypothetical protein [Polyangiaceae bacterium]
MRTISVLAMLGGILVVGAAHAACYKTTCEGYGTCPYPDDYSKDATPDVNIPDGCDATADPKDFPACLIDSYAVFIDSNNGDDSAPGTKTSPVKTITHALTLLGDKPRIYICGDGTLTEHVELASTISLVGGYDCSWTYTGQKPKISPTTIGPALTLTKLDQVIISDLAFEAQSATNPGESSIAVIANQSNVNFKRCDLRAGAGQNGRDGNAGVASTNYDTTKTRAPTGNSATGSTGGDSQDCSTNRCATGPQSGGGQGGTGGADSTNGTDGTPNNGGGKSGTANMDCGSGGLGGKGGDGTSGQSGTTPTAPTPGMVTSGSGALGAEGIWMPAMSQTGILGSVGQGGGGGGGGDPGDGSAAGGGGGGGCGGCGGSPGTAAQAGGASIALISYRSQVTLAGCTLTAGQAGNGGQGAAGQSGQLGGFGGDQKSPGCQGGAGGKGGDGGSSAGGSGGIAAGILWTGDAPPTTESTNITPGYKGNPGVGGNPGSNDGLDGQVGTMLQVKP